MWRRLEIPGGPFNKHGSVNQGYLFPLNDRAVCLLAGQVVPAQPLPPEFVAAIDEAQQRVWDEFLDWGRQFLETGSIRDEERSWKLAGSANVAAVRAAFESGDPAWLDAMKRAFAKNNWATDYRTHDDLLRWWNDHPDAARRAAAIIWDRNSEPATCIAGFWNEIPREVVSGNGTQAAVASFLFGERAAEQFPLFRSEPYQAAYALTGCWRKTLTVTETYQWALEFLDRVIAEASQRGLTLVDRLDAQTLLWCVVKHEPPEQWSEERRQALLHYRAGKQVARAESVPPRDPIAELAERLLLPRTFIEETGRLLESKGQVVFYGPPGTGKTFVARELARYFAGDPDNVEIVQFHPSYTYEDFVEGFRPRSKGEQVGFELVRGPLRRLARRAAKDPTGKYVLLIDEINRGNVAKVFGELYFLLEYRNERIRLQYDHRRTFSLPDNLWIIGTMNTADRSIALMDAALRRRFFFLPFFPDEPPIAGLLHRWLERHRPQMLKVAPIVERANKLLGERHGAIGPSHFLRLDLDDHWLSLIWKHAVMPYLAEQFFGEEERLKAFTLEALQAMNDAPAELQA